MVAGGATRLDEQAEKGNRVLMADSLSVNTNETNGKSMNVTIEKQKDGTYIAYNTTDDTVTLIGTGDTVAGAKSDFFNSMEEVREACREAEMEVPEALDGEPVFTFDISSLFEYYNMINVSAFARSLGINEGLMRQYKQGKAYISDSQLKKIEDGIHSLGNELSRLKLV